MIYDAPKTGGTTLRFWLYYIKTGKLPDIDNNQPGKFSYVSASKSFSSNINELGYQMVQFRKYSESSTKICILRDPVSRFVSCFNDKLIRENRWKRFSSMKSPTDLEGFLCDMQKLSPSFKWKVKKLLGYNNDMKGNYLRFHFAPLVYHYGSNPNYYDKVFWTHEINTTLKCFLEDLFCLDLPMLHTRNISNSPLAHK